MVDKTELIVGVNTDEVKEGTKNLKDFGTTGEKTESKVARLEKATEKLNDDFKRQAKAAGLSANEVKLLALKDAGATKEQLALARSSMEVADKAKKQAKAVKDAAMSAGATGGPFRAMRGSMQQVSWQLQDVAVQAQMGTSAFTIIGQQGPQMASIFGPGGAVLGALVAFGAMIGGTLYNSLIGTGEAMKELADDAKTLRDNFDDLGPAAQAFQRFLVTEEIKNAKENLADLNAELEKGKKTTVTGFGGQPGVIQQTKVTESDEDFAKRELELKQSIERTTHIIKVKQEAVDNLTTRTQDLIKSLNEEIRVEGESEAAIIRTSQAYLEANATQKETIEELIKESAAKKQKVKDDEKDIENTEKVLKLSADLNKAGIKGIELLKLQQAEKLKALKDAGASGSQIKVAEDNLAREMDVAVKAEKIRTDAEALREKNRQDAEAKKVVAEKANTQNRLLRLSQNAMNELALINSIEQEKINFENEQLALEKISKEEHAQAILDIETAAQQKRQELREKDALSRKADSDKEIAEAKALAAAKATIENQALQSAQNIATSLHGIAEEGSKEAKILFAIQKAIAIAQIIVATEQAALVASTQAAIGGPFAWLASVTGIKAMGYASAGIVAGTAIAGGRALGGQVRGGESYLVGERGPELLTMGTSGRIATNENLKNAVGGDNNNTSNVVNVNFAIQANDTAGFDRLLQSRRGQIVGMINQAVNNRGRASIV